MVKHRVWDISVHKYLLKACCVPGMFKILGNCDKQDRKTLSSGVYILKWEVGERRKEAEKTRCG